jgi:hypothetical protein
MTGNNLGHRASSTGGGKRGIDRLEEARVTFELAQDVYREARMDRWDDRFEAQLRAIDDLIASPLSGSPGKQLETLSAMESRTRTLADRRKVFAQGRFLTGLTELTDPTPPASQERHVHRANESEPVFAGGPKRLARL